MGGDVSFGTYNPANTSATTASRSVSVECTKGTAYTLFNVVLSWDTTTGQVAAFMTDTNSNKLYFQQYIPSANAWADDNNYQTSYHTTATGTGAAQNYTETFRILPNQYVSPANYSVSETTYVNF